MNIVQVIILSIVQGITEWLPISSSGHLVLFENWMQVEASLSFDIFLHVASLVVIIFFFRKQIVEIFNPWQHKSSQRKNWLWYIVLSSLFTAVIGLVFYQSIDSFRNIDVVSSWLLVTSLLLLATKFSRQNKVIAWPQAIVLGIAQGFAVLPGLSRSGAVIAVALLIGIKKEEAFDYAFILAVPAILGSFLLSLSDFNFSWLYLLGFLVTIVVSYFALVLLKLIIKKDYFYLFFVYTLVLALLLKL